MPKLFDFPTGPARRITALAAAVLLGACATAPVTPPVTPMGGPLGAPPATSSSASSAAPLGAAPGSVATATATSSVPVAAPARLPAAAAVPPVVASGPARPLAAVAPASVALVPPGPGAPAVAPLAVAPGGPPPFAVVTKDARKVDGLFTTWQKDEKVWIELRPEDFNQTFFFSPKLTSGIGEARLFGGLMLSSPRLVQFRRQYNLVQMLAINEQQVAQAGTPQARAVAAATSPSLLGATLVASQPHPERKTVLVDANALFVTDLLGLGGVLQRSFRQGYGFDGRNSAITAVRGKPDLLVLEVNSHYATASIAVPQPGAPPGAPVPSVPSQLPDARSLFLGLHYSLARLPAQPMARRAADPRLGHFVSFSDDFTNDLARSPRQRYVERWRLEKKEPAAELSEPVKPITYWLDRNIPLAYRAAITEGVLAWNQAFEAIGFKDAIVVKQQADDADFDTLDAGIASLRWMVNRDPFFGAIGPSHVDPRSGEILDADIGLESLSSRSLRSVRTRVFGGTDTAAAAQEWAALLQVGDADGAAAAQAAGGHFHDGQRCRHGEFAAEQMSYTMDVLAARGEITSDGPEAQQFVLDYLKGVAMHEVGHTLGLRHNFRASRAYSLAQLSSAEFTARNGITGSVMEYPAENLPPPGVPFAQHGATFRAALGPYDYWAIEYAYRPIEPAKEAAELQRIAGRSAEPQLAFGTDEDNFLGIDPDALQFDLGDDVLAFAARRFDIAQDLFKRQETRPLKPDEDYASLRRVLTYAVRDAGRAAGVLLRQVGGVRTLRDFPNTGRDPLQPLPAAEQRAALQLLSQRVLSADSFAVSPALQRKLAPDFLERGDSFAVPTEFALAQTVLDLQRGLLNRLMSDALAARVLDNAGKLSPPAQPLRLAELYNQLEADIWSELAGRGDIRQPRRELQREHINRLAALLLRPGAMSRSDARALLRSRSAALAQRIEAAASRQGGLSAEARLHLKDSAESLRSALAAPLSRAGA